MWEAPKLRASVGFIQILLKISKNKDFFSHYRHQDHHHHYLRQPFEWTEDVETSLAICLMREFNGP